MFTIIPKLIYVHKLGDTVTFQCDANDQASQRRSVIQWRRKDGTPLPFSRTTIDGTNFSIENINETDRGIYQCVASNEAATITADSELLIENVAPRPPYNLTANSTDTSITLHWEPGTLFLNVIISFNGEMIFEFFIYFFPVGYIRSYLEYTIWYRLVDATDWRTHRMIEKHPHQATITNLEPGREYEFMVLSQDQFGDGMFSKSFRYFTKGLD